MSIDTRPIRGLLFDLDGTLIDSREDIADSANALRISRGLEPLSLDVIGSYIGDGIEALVRQLMGPEFESTLPVLVDEFRSHYNEHCVVKTYLYDGVLPTLQALRAAGYAMAVVTNKPEKISLRILEKLGVGGCFGAVIGGNTVANKKPHPQPLEEACRRLGLPLSASCMIGDSRVDIEAGKNAGIPSIAIKDGIGDQALLAAAGPDLTLAAFGELTQHLRGA